MRDFKFFQNKPERVFTEWMDMMDDYHLGGIQYRPEGISNRHWNLLPDYIRNGGDSEVMRAYIDGWESPRGGDAYNPWRDNFNLSNTWSMGRDARQRRMNRDRLRPSEMDYYHTDDMVFFDVTDIRYDHDGDPYKVMLYRHIENGNTIEGERIYTDHPMWRFPDVM